MIETIMSIINIEYSLSIIILSYCVLKLIKRKTSTIFKRTITTIISIILGFIFYLYGESKIESLILGFALALIAYDFIINKILKYLKINYNGNIKSTREQRGNSVREKE